MRADAKKIIQIISNSNTQIDFNTLTPDADLRDIGADSLDMMNILLAVQEEYGLEIPDEKIEDLSSVSDICDFVNSVGK